MTRETASLGSEGAVATRPVVTLRSVVAGLAGGVLLVVALVVVTAATAAALIAGGLFPL